MEIVNLFATPIYKVNLPPNDFQYNALDELLSTMLASSVEHAWAGETGKSTGEKDLYLFRKIEMRWLLDAAMPHVRTFWKQLDYRSTTNLSITSSWANLHQYGQTTKEHSHCGGAEKGHISAVYYFKKPEHSGNIMFTDPLEYIHKMTPVAVYDETIHSMHHEVKADQFDLVLFPSWVKHQTQPNLSNEDRIAISINYIGTW